MDIVAKTINDAGKQATPCAVALVFARKKLSAAAAQLDAANGGLVSAALASGEIQGNVGDSVMLHNTADNPVKRVLLVGCGKADKLGQEHARKIIAAVTAGLKASKTRTACVYLEDLHSEQVAPAQLCSMLARAATTASYTYKDTIKKPRPALHITRLTVSCGKSLPMRQASAALREGQRLGEGINLAQQLGNLPGNICTPTFLASQAKDLARNSAKLSTRILEEKQMRELGMGSLLSVSAGSDQPAKFIIMQYKGGKASQKPYVLVGKGITFDSGGISLKPGAKMDEMKFDMCGAASVFGTMQTVVDMNLPLNVIGVVVASENMPNGNATKPGDVVKSMSGQTIEVLNTDAEGRLVLCDALTYVERYKPAAVIDIATLTGACVVALGAHASAMYSNNEKLAEQLISAGESTYDRAWRMPLWDEYQKQIDTPFADMANVGGPAAGSVTAACFLARFTGKYHWAHLDIAGSAWNSAPKGATGRPVALLTRYLMDRAGV